MINPIFLLMIKIIFLYELIRNHLSSLNEDEQRRFEFYVRSKIDIAQVKKVMEDVIRTRSNLQISDEVKFFPILNFFSCICVLNYKSDKLYIQMGIIVASLCKTYVCEIVEQGIN